MSRPFTPVYYEITVNVEPGGTISYGGRDIKGDTLSIDTPLSIIVLNLVDNSGLTPPAAFATFPVQWMTQEGRPEPNAPAAFQVSRDSNTQVSLLDVNTAQPMDSQRFHFLPTIAIGGTLRAPMDPTIINKEPPNFLT